MTVASERLEALATALVGESRVLEVERDINDKVRKKLERERDTLKREFEMRREDDIQARLRMSAAQARATYQDFDGALEKFKVMALQNPRLVNDVRAAVNPAEAAYQHVKWVEAQEAQVGSREREIEAMR
jgi:hypothetical protein